MSSTSLPPNWAALARSLEYRADMSLTPQQVERDSKTLHAAWRRSVEKLISDEESEDLLVTYYQLHQSRKPEEIGRALATAILAAINRKQANNHTIPWRRAVQNWAALSLGLETRTGVKLSPQQLETDCKGAALEQLWFRVVGEEIRHHELEDFIVAYYVSQDRSDVTEQVLIITLLLAAKRNLTRVDEAPVVQQRLLGVETQVHSLERVFQIRLTAISWLFEETKKRVIWAALILVVAAVWFVSVGFVAGQQSRTEDLARLADKAFDALAEEHSQATLAESKAAFSNQMQIALQRAPTEHGPSQMWSALPASFGAACLYIVSVVGCVCIVIGFRKWHELTAGETDPE